MKSISIHTEYITLGQLLKLADCIDSGGHAKHFLQNTPIFVNGEPENRRGKKLYSQDKIKVSGCGEFQVIRS